MTTDLLIKTTRDRLSRTTTVDGVRTVLAELDAAEAGPDTPPRGVEDLREQAIQSLREVTASDLDAAVEILRRDVLPRCLRVEPEDGPSQYSAVTRACGEWLNDLPEERRAQVRDEAVHLAIEALGDGRVRSALRLIATIGYADRKAISRIEELVTRRGDRLGDHALSVRASLGVDPARRASLREVLHRRMPRRWNLPLVSASKILGDLTTLDLLFSWLEQRGPEPEESHCFDITLGVVYAIARHADEPTASRIWTRLLTLQPPPATRRRDVFLVGSPGVTFDSSLVIPEFLRRATAADSIPRYSLYTRLSECVRPRQLAGWDNVPTESLAVVRQDATRPTGMTGNFVTVEYRQKTQAWNVLLSAGRVGELPPLEAAVAGETSGGVIGELLGLASCVQPVGFPPTAAHLLREPLPGTAWDVSEYFSAYVGAIAASHGAASRESFDALMKFRTPGDHGILLSLIEALAMTAVCLARSGDRAPLSLLMDAAEGKGDKHTQDAAAAALGVVYARGAVLSNPEAERVARLALDSRVDPYSRRMLLHGLADNPQDPLSSDLLSRVAAILAPGSTLTDQEKQAGLAEAALDVLASHTADPTVLAAHTGLVENDAEFVVGADLKRVQESARVIGALFQRHPVRFAKAVAAIIRTSDPLVMAQIVVPIRWTAAGTPAAVTEALKERLNKMAGGRISEPAVLEAMAMACPGSLLSLPWPDLEHWMPQARTVLAGTLGALGALGGPEAVQRIELLARLAGDGLYPVRRAAYRALQECAADDFMRLVSSWAVTKSVGGEGVRRRAAEASGWLTPAVADGPIAALEWDPEPAVRETYRKAQEERDERLIAELYLDRVLAVATPSEVVGAWRFGEALGRCGDDRIVDLLDRRADKDLHPAVRFWIRRIQKAVKRRWDEVTRKWPEPWFVRRGVFEPLSGAIRSYNGKQVEVSGFVWVTTPEPPERLYSWGGWVVSQHIEPGEQELLLPGHKPVPILVTHSQLPAGTAVFSGNGDYPRINSPRAD